MLSFLPFLWKVLEILMKKGFLFLVLTHLRVLLLIDAWTNFPTVTCQNGENQVASVLVKKLTTIFKPTFIILTLR